jgi:hypothetical protein
MASVVLIEYSNAMVNENESSIIRKRSNEISENMLNQSGMPSLIRIPSEGAQCPMSK